MLFNSMNYFFFSSGHYVPTVPFRDETKNISKTRMTIRNDYLTCTQFGKYF